jgi:hypothetical protein
VTWAQTAGALLRGRPAPAPGALASIPGPDARSRAEQYPDAAAEHRAAWAADRWAFQGRDEDTGEPCTQFVDNAGIREQQRQLAEQGAPIGWLDFPKLGLPPEELKPLYMAAAASASRIGTVNPDGSTDEAFQQMIREADYARTPWAGITGIG